MKKIFVLLWLLTSVMHASSQDYIIVRGTISNEDSIAVPNHKVTIESDNPSQFSVTYTNENGFYSDTLMMAEEFSVSTYDCKGIKHMRHIKNPQLINTVHFVICSDSCILDADFNYYPDDSNVLYIRFVDLSAGEHISHWYWDFDDGMSSNEQNPVHLYQAPGLYTVKLTVTDSSGYCSDGISRIVVVGDTSNSCKADFSIALDSISNIPFKYIFTDKSEGEITNWMWDFGDSNYSVEQNPIHTYVDSGSYQVCLTVRGQHGDDTCVDTFCRQIKTPAYYNFGGQAFAGDYPINIEPDDSSNIAVAQLYRRYKQQWHLMDTRSFWKYGYFWFVNKLPGDYLIRIDLDRGAPLSPLYAPGYYGDALHWQNSTPFHLEDSDVFDANIDLNPLYSIGIGTGILSGYIYNKDGCDGFHAENIPVFLFDENNNLVSYTYTDSDGDYEFDQLPSGSYEVSAEYTGRYSDAVPVEVNENSFETDSVSIGISCSDPNGIFYRFASSGLIISNIYPRPANRKVTIVIESDRRRNIDLLLYSISGQKVKFKTETIIKGKNEVSLELSDLPEGFFFLRLADKAHRLSSAEKVLIKH